METWIGLAHVRPLEGNKALGGGIGAFVPVVGLASSAIELADLAATLLYQLQFEVVEVEDMEPFAIRLKDHAVDSELIEVTRALNENDRVGLGAFEVYTA